MIPEEVRSFLKENDATDLYDQLNERFDRAGVKPLPEKSEVFAFRFTSSIPLGSHLLIFELVENEDGSGYIVQKRARPNTIIERTDQLSEIQIKRYKEQELNLGEIWDWTMIEDVDTSGVYDVSSSIIEVSEKGRRHMVFRSSLSKDEAFWKLSKAISEIERRSEQGSRGNER